MLQLQEWERQAIDSFRTKFLLSFHHDSEAFPGESRGDQPPSHPIHLTSRQPNFSIP
jgi:hypothetical protein